VWVFAKSTRRCRDDGTKTQQAIGPAGGNIAESNDQSFESQLHRSCETVTRERLGRTGSVVSVKSNTFRWLGFRSNCALNANPGGECDG
jgi:hypothetical protein